MPEYLKPLAALIVLAELFIMYETQRKVLWEIHHTLGRGRLGWWLALALKAPSTIAHEIAHLLMAAILRVPFGNDLKGGGKIELFRPRTDPKTGSVTLGQVAIGQVDPLRNTLVSIAPVILVPLFDLGITKALLGTWLPTPQLLLAAPWGYALIWIVTITLVSLAAFPSPGDHIGFLGALLLVGLAVFISWQIFNSGGWAAVNERLVLLAWVLAAPALGCALMRWLVRCNR